jgi:hypothetical protein
MSVKDLKQDAKKDAYIDLTRVSRVIRIWFLIALSLHVWLGGVLFLGW